MEAVQNPALTDQRALSRAAQFDSSLGVKVRAASRLDDQVLAQEVYAEVIASRAWGRWLYAIVAASHVTDQVLLEKVATTDESFEVRREATRHLANQAVLAKLAASAGSTMQQMDAIARLADPVLLRKIAARDPDWHVRKAAQAALARQREIATPSDRTGHGR